MKKSLKQSVNGEDVVLLIPSSKKKPKTLTEQLFPDRRRIVEHLDGKKEWTHRGKLHHTEGPALILPDGEKRWYQNGTLHRIDGPAIEAANGDRQWYQFGRLHRIDGPAIESANGAKEWYHLGLRHREGGPAIEMPDGLKAWYYEGRPHRLDGPAIQGSKRGPNEYYLHGYLITQDPLIAIISLKKPKPSVMEEAERLVHTMTKNEEGIIRALPVEVKKTLLALMLAKGGQEFIPNPESVGLLNGLLVTQA